MVCPVQHIFLRHEISQRHPSVPESQGCTQGYQASSLWLPCLSSCTALKAVLVWIGTWKHVPTLSGCLHAEMQLPSCVGVLCFMSFAEGAHFPRNPVRATCIWRSTLHQCHMLRRLGRCHWCNAKATLVTICLQVLLCTAKRSARHCPYEYG